MSYSGGGQMGIQINTKIKQNKNTPRRVFSTSAANGPNNKCDIF
jgi:hypothetical protein